MKPDGGPAFPRVTPPLPADARFHPGMTLRDYFAAHAPCPPEHFGFPAMADWAYEYADAMLAKREKP